MGTVESVISTCLEQNNIFNWARYFLLKACIRWKWRSLFEKVWSFSKDGTAQSCFEQMYFCVILICWYCFLTFKLLNENALLYLVFLPSSHNTQRVFLGTVTSLKYFKLKHTIWMPSVAIRRGKIGFWKILQVRPEMVWLMTHNECYCWFQNRWFMWIYFLFAQRSGTDVFLSFLSNKKLANCIFQAYNITWDLLHVLWASQDTQSFSLVNHPLLFT